MANAYRAYRTIERRQCRQIMVGSVPVGGDAPISVQTMTNTLRPMLPARWRRSMPRRRPPISFAYPAPTRTAPRSARYLAASPVPIVADIHFHYRRAIEAAAAGAACLRINPGNIGREDRVVK